MHELKLTPESQNKRATKESLHINYVAQLIHCLTEKNNKQTNKKQKQQTNKQKTKTKKKTFVLSVSPSYHLS